MSYCLAIAVDDGMVFCSDSRTAEGVDRVSTYGKMFRFGMFALEQFKERLHEWPQYCSHIVQIP